MLLRHKKAMAKGLALICGLGLLLFSGLYLGVSTCEEKLHPKQAYRFYDRNGELLTTLISGDDFFRMHVPLEKISPLFVKTLLLEEDQFFYRHVGVNPFSIVRALKDNLIAGRVVCGGSTITMQLSRMLDRRDRTVWAKVIEAVRAIKLEMRFSKDEILSYYLALAPYGGNVEGLQAAAFTYFGKPACLLSAGEIALLVGIPKSPNKRRPDRHQDTARHARDRILGNMAGAGLITPDQYRRALAEPVAPRARDDQTGLFLHSAWHLRSRHPDTYVWHTTIDRNLQQRVKALMSRYVDTLFEYNIKNASVVVIDNAAGEVRAVLGSTDYFSDKSQGANDGARAPRSPGSTLKPFLYGLAFQQGLISEKTILYDVPINYAGYSPRNYSREFMGPVTAHEALTESLNVVAVRLSRHLGPDKLYALISQCGISTLHEPVSYYGLPLVLGGVEIKLSELAGMYAALANNGVYRPLRLAAGPGGLETGGKEVRVLSKEAAWLVTHILTDVRRPDFPESWQFAKNRPAIAWKTGTSYGHQDAWALGYTRAYTVGVWVGNFDGSPSKGLAGGKTAGPILFDVFQSILETGSRSLFPKPATVKLREFCSKTGKLPSRHCPVTMKAYSIDGGAGNNAYNAMCQVHQQITIDNATGMQATSETPEANRVKKVIEVWPPEMASFMMRHGVPLDNVPGYNPGLMAGQAYYAPRILSPVPRTIYYQRFDKLDKKDHGIKLSGAVTNRVKVMYWFLNDELIGTTTPKQDLIINPGPGDYVVALVDDTGGMDRVDLIVRDYRERRHAAADEVAP